MLQSRKAQKSKSQQTKTKSLKLLPAYLIHLPIYQKPH